MNEQTSKLIEQLANKLGTTAEYLWSVLIKQAPIAAITDLLILILTAVIFMLSFRNVFKYIKKNEPYNSDYYGHIFAFSFCSAIIGIALLVQIFCIGGIINGFFNPEYWALNKILDSLNQ